jgi:hypothetical protein
LKVPPGIDPMRQVIVIAQSALFPEPPDLAGVSLEQSCGMEEFPEMDA